MLGVSGSHEPPDNDQLNLQLRSASWGFRASFSSLFIRRLNYKSKYLKVSI